MRHSLNWYFKTYLKRKILRIDINISLIVFFNINKLKSNYFDIKPISAFDVKHCIDYNLLIQTNQHGMNGIGPKILKICVDCISTLIKFIINKCISEGIFPDSFKIASAVPLHKNGSKSDQYNYRPISILPTLSKIFERHISTQFLSFLTKHNVIESNHSVFRICCTALINLIDKWLKDVDDGKYVGAHYF